MKILYNKKLKTILLTGIMALAINNSACADHYSVGSVNFDTGFTIKIGGSDSDGGGYYLTYSPNDRIVGDREKLTLKGGELYILAESHYWESDSDYSYTSLGPVKGDDFSEEQLKIIKDLIANVEGNQIITGSQQVQGGQTVSGGFTYSFKQSYKNLRCFA